MIRFCLLLLVAAPACRAQGVATSIVPVELSFIGASGRLNTSDESVFENVVQDAFDSYHAENSSYQVLVFGHIIEFVSQSVGATLDISYEHFFLHDFPLIGNGTEVGEEEFGMFVRRFYTDSEASAIMYNALRDHLSDVFQDAENGFQATLSTVDGGDTIVLTAGGTTGFSAGNKKSSISTGASFGIAFGVLAFGLLLAGLVYRHIAKTNMEKESKEPTALDAYPVEDIPVGEMVHESTVSASVVAVDVIDTLSQAPIQTTRNQRNPVPPPATRVPNTGAGAGGGPDFKDQVAPHPKYITGFQSSPVSVQMSSQDGPDFKDQVRISPQERRELLPPTTFNTRATEDSNSAEVTTSAILKNEPSKTW